MWKFIFKVRFLLEKVMQRTNVEAERYYIENTFSEIIEKDDKALRAELAKLKAIQNPTTEMKKQIMDLDVEITEIMTYRSMLVKSDNKVAELQKLIDKSKEFLWK
jgi:hypothetical protein